MALAVSLPAALVAAAAVWLAVLVLQQVRRALAHAHAAKRLGVPEPPRISLWRMLTASRHGLADFFHRVSNDPVYGGAQLAKLWIPGFGDACIVTGPQGGREYAFNKELSLIEGVRFLMDPYWPDGIATGVITRRIPRLARAVSVDKHVTFVDAIWRHTNQLVAQWPDRGEIDLFNVTYVMLTELVTRSITGNDITGDALREFIRNMRTVDASEHVLLHPWIMLVPVWFFRRTAAGREVAEANDNLFKIIERIAHERLEAARRGEPAKTDFFQSTLETVTDEVTGEIDYSELAESIKAIVVASNTNTFASYSWTMVHLLKYEGHIDRVRAEIAQARRDFPEVIAAGTMTSEFLDSLVYLECCMRESIRMRTPGISFRKTTADTIMCGRYVPAGKHVILPHSLLHYLPELYPEPDQFRPERHLIELDGKPAVDYSTARVGELQVFGAGRHPCVGWKAGTQLVKVMIVALLEQMSEVELMSRIEDVDPQQVIGVGRPANVVKLRFARSNTTSSGSVATVSC